MRIAAIYIYPKSHEYIFGEDHKAITLNLGGKYFYELDENGKKVINKNLNSKFIDSFWPENILNVSAIVGANGTGKSTVLELIKTGCQLVIENEDEEEIVWSQDVEAIYYYTPFLNDNRAEEEGNNVINISKLSRIIKDTKFENMNFDGHWEYHKSERLAQLISFLETSAYKETLAELEITKFKNIKIQFRRINKDDWNTSRNFTSFFEALGEKNRAEQKREEQKFIESRKPKKAKEVIESEDYKSYSRNLRLKLTILDCVARKIHSILERTGNTYLEEGYVGKDLSSTNKEFVSIESTREAFKWFIEKAYVQEGKDKHYLPINEILAFVDLLLDLVNSDENIENTTVLSVDFEKGIKIISAYQKFLISFRKIFTYDETIFMVLSPDKKLSSGEMSMYELFSTLHNSNHRLEQNLETNYKAGKIYNIHTFLLDEADLGFHPYWKRKYINFLCDLLPKIFKDQKLQIIITTHDPLTLSDIPNSNIAYLKKEGEKTDLLQLDDPLRPDKSFAANITDLLSNSFFLETGLIGDYAKNKINDVLGFLNIKILKKEIREINSKQEIAYSEARNVLKFHKEMELNELLEITPDLSFSYCKSLINNVDEPLLKSAMEEMYYELNPNNEESIESIKAYAKRLGRNDIADQL